MCGGSACKKSSCNTGDLGSIPGLGRYPGEGKGYPLQYSGLENSIYCCSPWGGNKLDTTEQISLSVSLLIVNFVMGLFTFSLFIPVLVNYVLKEFCPLYLSGYIC